MKTNRTLTIILEKGDDELWGRINDPGFLLTSVGASVEEVTTNLRDLVADFLEHEGKDSPQWNGIRETDITYDIEYDLTALFDVFKAIKITSIAEIAGINASLMRQYATGNKKPSARQAQRIESALRQLGERLAHVSVA